MEITLENGLQWADLIWGSAPLVQKSFKGRKMNEDSQAGNGIDMILYVANSLCDVERLCLFQYC